MRLAIIGLRTATDYAILDGVMARHFTAPMGKQDDTVETIVTEVISGGAAGADTLGARWATERQIKLTVFKPDWNRFGKRAGFVRNEDIVAAADVVLAIWDGSSKGTQNSLSIAKRLKKPTIIIYS
jgi:hypothetical protein